MSGMEMAKRRVVGGYRVRFYQDFFGRQWVKVQGGWMFWRSRKIYLHNEEILELKELIAQRRKSGGGRPAAKGGVSVVGASTADAA